MVMLSGFLLAVSSEGGGVTVGENPPIKTLEGALWFDTERLELYVYYVEGEDGGWLPSSPLGARVAAGEAKQTELEGRIQQGEQNKLITNICFQTITYLSEHLATIKDLTIVDRPGGIKPLMIKKSGVDHVKIEAGTKSSVTTTWILIIEDDRSLFLTKVGSTSSFLVFIKDYDGNRFCVQGSASTFVEDGQVLFLNDQMVSTTNPSEVVYLSLPPNEIDWNTCLDTGTIKVKAGSSTAGYYAFIIKMMQSNSRQMLVSVSHLKLKINL